MSAILVAAITAGASLVISRRSNHKADIDPEMLGLRERMNLTDHNLADLRDRVTRNEDATANAPQETRYLGSRVDKLEANRRSRRRD